ncbi:MAG: HAMP domain-containing histidine kinase [Bdellovibrionales bacterium]|nr:HAMP domain-containing histidine kinase [Bdellovibrionales bacterium]
MLLLLNSIQLYREIEQKNQALDDVVELATLGLNQKNRVLVESALNLAVQNLNINHITLCEDSRVVYSHPNTNGTCSDISTSLLSLRIKKSAIGLKGIEFVFVLSWIRHFALLVYSLMGLFIISSTFAVLVWKLRSKFVVELLEPLLPSYEANSPIQEIQNIVFERKQLEEFKVKSAVGDAISTMASQVSHDIRSPLSALNMALGSISELPEPQRIMMRSAIQRINDIANDLLNNRKHLTAKAIDSPTTHDIPSIFLKAELLTPLIDSIVSEKRIQFREKQEIEIEGDLSEGYGLFAMVNATELKRTISNLVNNAVEAFPNEAGKITVAVRNYRDQVAIIIQDNGKGIPEHILVKLGERDVSFGKEGTQSGSGLGVYHAKKL